jgi:hypothetical protein
MTDEEIRKYLDERKSEALRIDPKTADVLWDYNDIMDPYCVYNRPVESIGRDYFARNPGSRIWVWFGDLPDVTRDELWRKHRHALAFPAGLEKLFAKRSTKE